MLTCRVISTIYLDFMIIDRPGTSHTREHLPDRARFHKVVPCFAIYKSDNFGRLLKAGFAMPLPNAAL